MNAQDRALEEARYFAQLPWDSAPMLVVQRRGDDKRTAIVLNVEGHPVDAVNMLVEQTGPFEAEWAALCIESWQLPDSVPIEVAKQWYGRFHQHPDRIEVRMTNVVYADGSHAMVIEERGSEPELHEYDRIEGRVIHALRNAIAIHGEHQ